jgi:hypothetical protein
MGKSDTATRAEECGQRIVTPWATACPFFAQELFMDDATQLVIHSEQCWTLTGYPLVGQLIIQGSRRASID